MFFRGSYATRVRFAEVQGDVYDHGYLGVLNEALKILAVFLLTTKDSIMCITLTFQTRTLCSDLMFNNLTESITQLYLTP